MFERLNADRRKDTMTMANGFGIAMGGTEAYRNWLAQDAPKRPAGAPGDVAAIAAQNATISRLEGLLAHQPSPGLRKAIERVN